MEEKRNKFQFEDFKTNFGCIEGTKRKKEKANKLTSLGKYAMISITSRKVCFFMVFFRNCPEESGP